MKGLKALYFPLLRHYKGGLMCLYKCGIDINMLLFDRILWHIVKFLLTSVSKRNGWFLKLIGSAAPEYLIVTVFSRRLPSLSAHDGDGMILYSLNRKLESLYPIFTRGHVKTPDRR